MQPSSHSWRNNGNSQPGAPRSYLTEEAATVLRYQPQTLRRDLCLKGHFKGIVPTKLPGGRLLWPADKIDALARGEEA
jgi:hypothetical protein